MDAEFASVAAESIAAALKGQHWIDETYGVGSWKWKYYTSVCMLQSSSDKAWRTYLQVADWYPGEPSTNRLRTLQKVFLNILARNGIYLFHLDIQG